MKKRTILVAAAVVAMTLASCKKDYTCKCTETNSKNSDSDEYTFTIKDVSKGQAKANCVSTTSTDNNVTYTSDCKLS
jgi:hypothetical protein